MGVIDSQVEVMEDCHKEIPGGGFHHKWSIDSIPSIHSIAWQVKLVVVGYMVMYTLLLRWCCAGGLRGGAAAGGECDCCKESEGEEAGHRGLSFVLGPRGLWIEMRGFRVEG